MMIKEACLRNLQRFAKQCLQTRGKSKNMLSSVYRDHELISMHFRFSDEVWIREEFRICCNIFDHSHNFSIHELLQTRQIDEHRNRHQTVKTSC